MLTKYQSSFIPDKLIQGLLNSYHLRMESAKVVTVIRHSVLDALN